METEFIKSPANLIFIGFMFIGIAVGLLLNVVAAGTLIGMGTGFIARALLLANSARKIMSKENKTNTL